MNTLNTTLKPLQNNTYNLLGLGIAFGIVYFGFLNYDLLRSHRDSDVEAVALEAARTAAVQQQLAEIQPERLANDIKTDMKLKDVEMILAQKLRGPKVVNTQALATHLMKLSREHKVSPSLILAVIGAESTYRVYAKSHVGALGLMQVLPPTAAFIAKKANVKSYHKAKDLYNPYINLEIGVSYIAYLRTRFDNSIHYVAAYNLGPTTVNRMINTNKFALGKVNKYVSEIHAGTRKLRNQYAAPSRFLASE